MHKSGYFVTFILFLSLTFDSLLAQDDSLTPRVEVLERKVANLVRRNQILSEQMEQTQTVLQKLDQAKGVLADYPTCPVAQEFNHIESLKSCYKLYPSSVLVNWTSAEELCQALSPKAHIVAIETQKEQNFLRAIWANERGFSTLSRFWTAGFKDTDTWSWTLVGEHLKYENWIATTPHNDERFNCMAVYATEDYHWLDVACWSSHAVTCEIMVTSETASPPRAKAKAQRPAKSRGNRRRGKANRNNNNNN